MDVSSSSITVVAKIVPPSSKERSCEGQEPCVTVRDDRLVTLCCNQDILSNMEQNMNSHQYLNEEEGRPELRLFEYIFSKAFSEAADDHSFIDSLLRPCFDLLESNQDTCIVLYGSPSSTAYS